MYKLNKKNAELVIQFYDVLKGKSQVDIPYGIGHTLSLVKGQWVFAGRDGWVFSIGLSPQGITDSPDKTIQYIVCDRRGYNDENGKDLYISPVSYKDPSTELVALTIGPKYVNPGVSEKQQKAIAFLGDDWLKELKRRGAIR